MKNTMNLNGKEVQQAAAAIYADLSANNVKAGNKDEMFEAVKKYVSITREQFDDYFNQLDENRELDEAELDMVAGGSFKDFICSPLGVAAFIAAGVLVGAGIGALAYGIGALLAGGTAVAAAGTTAAVGTTVATVGEAAAIGGFFGFFGGCAAECTTYIAMNPSTGTN